MDELRTGGQATSTLPIRDFIYRSIMSKKFRKFSVTPEFDQHVREVIENSVGKNEPLKFSFPFGGYKLWRLEETPEADWAELFTLMYYLKWLKPISENYAPGIWFDFVSDDVIVERMNNIPKVDTESYARSFNELIDFLKAYSPENSKITLTAVSSFYTQEEFEEDLKDKIEVMQNQLGGLPVLDDKHKKQVELNVKLKPGQHNDPLWREKTELLHQAYYTVSKRRPYNRAKDKILVFPTKMKDCIAVGTTKTSVVKFWVGVGALEKRSDGFIETILSPSQLEKSVFDRAPISIVGLKGKNFNKIKVLE